MGAINKCVYIIIIIPTARNLGVIFDSDFNFIPQINSIIKSYIYHMREFKRIHKHLDRDTAISVANAINRLFFYYVNLQPPRGADNAYFYGPIVPGADSSIIPPMS